MSTYRKVISELRRNKERREQGKSIAIPWPLKKLNNVLAGIRSGRYYMITGGPKSAKTQTADFLFLLNLIEWRLKNENKPDELLPRIFYYTLELSKEEKVLGILANLLFHKTNKIKSPEKLASMFENYILDNETLEQLDSFESTLNKIENFVTFIDDVKNPFGIYKTVLDYVKANGKVETAPFTTKDKDGKEIIREEVINYTPNNPNEIVFLIIDHIGLIREEKNQTQRDAITKLSSDYFLTLRNKYNVSLVVIQQQSLESDKQQFTNKGDSIINKLRPSMAGLGENKITSRDVNIMFGTFSPDKFNIEEYEDYNISILRGHYKELSIIANRHGMSNASVDLFFIGAVNHFEELPKPLNTSEIKKYYEFAKQNI